MEDKVFTAGDLMNYYEKVKVNCKLKPYVKLIRDSPVYPVIYDSNCEVLSLPPIINSEYSKISLGTKNVFIECTATDLTKAQIVLNMMTTMFAHYCEPAFSIEPVKVVYHGIYPVYICLFNFRLYHDYSSIEYSSCSSKS